MDYEKKETKGKQREHKEMEAMDNRQLLRKGSYESERNEYVR